MERVAGAPARTCFLPEESQRAQERPLHPEYVQVPLLYATLNRTHRGDASQLLLWNRPARVGCIEAGATRKACSPRNRHSSPSFLS